LNERDSIRLNFVSDLLHHSSNQKSFINTIFTLSILLSNLLVRQLDILCTFHFFDFVLKMDLASRILQALNPLVHAGLELSPVSSWLTSHHHQKCDPITIRNDSGISQGGFVAGLNFLTMVKRVVRYRQ